MTNEQAKQEAIKKAYGPFYEPNKDLIHNDGTVTNYIGGLMFEKGLEISTIDKTKHSRSIPDLIKDLENNNGWIRIEPDGSNLPEEYEFVRWLNLHEDLERDCVAPKDQWYFLKKYTHYKIIKPELRPIY